MNYLMTYWISTDHGMGYGNVPITLKGAPTLTDIREAEADMLEYWRGQDPSTRKIVMTGLIPCAD
jgi:hypothetical protein